MYLCIYLSCIYVFVTSTSICHVVESSDSISFNCSSRARSLRFILKMQSKRAGEGHKAAVGGRPSIKSMRAINLWAVHWNVPECKAGYRREIFLISARAKKEVRTFAQPNRVDQEQDHDQDSCRTFVRRTYAGSQEERTQCWLSCQFPTGGGEGWGQELFARMSETLLVSTNSFSANANCKKCSTVAKTRSEGEGEKKTNCKKI